MKTIRIIYKATNIIKATLAGLSLLCFSCNDTLENELEQNYSSSGTDAKQGKVLMIIMDGVSGRTMEYAHNNLEIPAISELLNKSIYTFNGLAESQNENITEFTNERGWANLLTGVTTHQIMDTDDLEQLETPTILSFMKQTKPTLSSALYASSGAFYKAFAKEADIKKGSEEGVGDEIVTQELIQALNANNVSDFIIAQLDGIRKTGEEEGFFQEQKDDEGRLIPTGAVTDALKGVDRQCIRPILAKLKARPHFAQENWLVVITSNYGGSYLSEKPVTYYDRQNRNTFTLMYNERFSSNYLNKPADDALKFEYFTPVYSWGTNERTRTARTVDPNLFNMGQGKPYTIQFMVRDGGSSSSSTATIFSKAYNGNDGNVTGQGWKFTFTGSRDLRIYANTLNGNRITTNTSEKPEKAAYDRRDKRWNVFTFVYDCETKRNTADLLTPDENGRYYWRAYCNGNFYRGNIEIRTGSNQEYYKNVDNDYPLRIGQITQSVANNLSQIMVSNIQIYDVALPHEYVKANFGKTRLDEASETFEYWDNLIGYWPCDRFEDMELNMLRDYSKYGSVNNGENAGKSDMIFESTSTWISGSETGGYVRPTPNDAYYKGVFNNVDLVYQSILWLSGNINSSWKLEGQGWAPIYQQK